MYPTKLGCFWSDLLTSLLRQAYVEFSSAQAATAAKHYIDQLLSEGNLPAQKKITLAYWNPMNPFKTLPKDAPARGKDQSRTPSAPYNERGGSMGNFGGGFRGRGGYNRGNMNQGNFNRNFNNNNNMGFNNMGGNFNGPMGGGGNFGFNSRGGMMGGGMRGGPGGMRGGRGGMMGMNPMGGMPMGMPGNMGMGMMGPNGMQGR